MVIVSHRCGVDVVHTSTVLIVKTLALCYNKPIIRRHASTYGVTVFGLVVICVSIKAMEQYTERVHEVAATSLDKTNVYTLRHCPS
jgi:hypothetical protein